MVDIRQFRFTITTVKGESVVDIRAFNRPQAKRKLMTQFSNKRDHPVIKKVELMG